MLITRVVAFTPRSPIAETILELAVLDSSKVVSESFPDALSIIMCVFCESNTGLSSSLSSIYSNSPYILIHLDGRRTYEAYSHRA